MTTRSNTRQRNLRSGLRPVHSLRASRRGFAGRLLVAVDGSAESEIVLEWAVITAEHLDLPVVAVTTAEDPSFRLADGRGGDPGGPGNRRRQIVASVRDRHPGADISHVQARGELAASVCQMVGEADLIVVAEPVGSAARSTSMSAYCRHYARCAVVIPPYEQLRTLQIVPRPDPDPEVDLEPAPRPEPRSHATVRPWRRSGSPRPAGHEPGPRSGSALHGVLEPGEPLGSELHVVGESGPALHRVLDPAGWFG
jgi:nucleotide-binding universal stress UspA family protein